MKLNNKGFTLVEVLAVVVIIAIIGGVAVNGVLSSINRGKKTSYDLMISDIIIASQTMYEEISFGNDIYDYDNNGPKINKVSISNNRIETSLQTLVSNGYLSGTENTCEGSGCNKNKRVLLNPVTSEDISDCRIIIEKVSGKYVVTNNSTSVSKCPDSYKEVVNND